jgi:hypothetical protein
MPLNLPTHDLCADLRNDADGELGDSWNVCSASNRKLRLYVAGYMLGSPAAALELYEGSGRDLLRAGGRLNTVDIVAEVLRLLPEGKP